MGLLASISDLVTKRALKFLLKRNFGKYLASELDQDSLDVQLGKGTIELKRLLLNCTQLNADLNSPYWEITEGFIGSIQATFPITSFSTDSCHAVVHEVLMTIKPASLQHPALFSSSSTSQHQHQQQQQQQQHSPLSADSELDDLDFGQATISDGIMQIAGGIEKIVQQLQLQASKVTVKIELPSVSSKPQGQPSLIMLHLDSLTYSGQTSPPLDAAVTRNDSSLILRKHITFEGLRVELFEAFDDPVAAAENEMLESQMHEAQQHQFAEVGDVEPFEVVQHAVHESDTSSIAADDNRHVVICSSDGVGCQGQIALQLTWHHMKQLHPHIAIDLNLNPFQIQLHPHHMPLLSKVADCLSESAQQAQRAQQMQKQAAGAMDRSSEGGLVASTRNFIESFALPDCERMAADALSWGFNKDPVPHNLYSSPYQSSFQSAAGYPADLHSMHSMADPNSNVRESMFHDAQSMMGSVTPTFNSFVSSTAASLGSGQTLHTSRSPSHTTSLVHQGQHQQQPSGQARNSPDEEEAKKGPLGWELTATCGEASIVLWYPEGQSHDPNEDFATSFGMDYMPRLCVETGNIDLTVTAINDSAVKCQLSLYQLECAEHLPVSASDAGPAAATLAEITQVPSLLPPCGRGARPLPSFIGVSSVPLTHSLYSSTLTQLASASYMSESGARPFAASTSQVQVWPVMCAGGVGIKSPGVTPSLQLSLNLHSSSSKATTSTARPGSGRPAASRPNTAAAVPSSGGGPATAVAEIKLRPSTVWISLPLLQRLQAFIEPLMNPAPTESDANVRQEPRVHFGTGTGGNSNGNSIPVDNILQDLEGLQANDRGRAESSSPLQVSVQAPHICAVVVLPPPPSGFQTCGSCHGNSYMALDLFAAAHMGQEVSQSPMLSLRAVPQHKASTGRGSSGTAPAAAPDMWEVDLAIGRAKAYLVGEPRLTTSADDMANVHLEAHCVLEILPAALADSGTALSATVTLTPGLPLKPGVIGTVWEGVQQHATSSKGLNDNASSEAQLNSVHLQQTCMAASGIRVQCRAPNIQATISQSDLAAVLELAGAISAWQAETRLASMTPTELVPMQICLLLECKLQASLLQQPQGVQGSSDDQSLFTADIPEVQLLNVSSLGGVMECGCLAIQAQGVTLKGGQDRGCLLYCPAEGPSCSSASSPMIEFWQVSRPCSTQSSRLVQPKPGQQAQLASHEGQSSALIRGTTFSTDAGDLRLSWLTDLAGFFAAGSSPQGVPPSAGSPSGDAEGGGASIVMDMAWSVGLQDIAVRYEASKQCLLDATVGSQSEQQQEQQRQQQQPGHVQSAVHQQPAAGIATQLQSQSRHHPHRHRHAQHQAAASQQSVAETQLRQQQSRSQDTRHSNCQPVQQGDTNPRSNSNGSQLSDSATQSSVRHQPEEMPVSAVLTLAGLQWGLQPGNDSQQICLQCISLYCADSASCEGTWALTHPVDMCTLQLAESGYGLIGQEAQLIIALKPPQDPADGFFETEVTNQHMGVSVTKTQLQLVTRLSSQISAQQSSSSDSSSIPAAFESQRSSHDEPDAQSGRGVNEGIVEWEGVAGEGRLRVMEGVQEDAFKREQSSPSASVFLEGRWFPSQETNEPDLTSSILNVDPRVDQAPAADGQASAPLVTEDYISPSRPSSEVADEWQDEPCTEETALWYGNVDEASNGGPSMQEDYVQQPSPSRQRTAESACKGGALGPLPDGYPGPLSRLVVRNLKLLIKLNQEMPSHADGAPQAEPNNGRLEVDLAGVCLQLDSFQAEVSPYVWRLAFSIHQLEVRDHVKQSKGRPARWRQVLGYHLKPQTLRHPSMLQVELTAVKPDVACKAQQEEEYRLSASLLPLRLRLHQSMISFLQSFFAVPVTARANSLQQKPSGNNMFLQKAEIQAFSLMVDYQPRSLDAAALRSGSFVEVLNLIPWGGVQLELPVVKASGLQGWDALGSAVGNAYLEDIASSQVHKFVVGVAPVRSLCRVGWAAKQLLAIPADQLRGNSPAYAGNSDVAVGRQLRRGVTALARAVTLEALGLGASVAGGADYVLRGGSGRRSEQPAGFKEGLKQAAQGLSSGLETAASKLVYSPVRSVKEGEGVSTAVVRAVRNAPGAIAAPVAAAAAATRATFLGVRNAIDPERYEQRSR